VWDVKAFAGVLVISRCGWCDAREEEDRDRTQDPLPAVQAAGRGDLRAGDQFVPPAPALSAEGKAAKTVRTYTEAVRWFAAAHLLGQGNGAPWEEIGERDVQEWVAWLLGRYSGALCQ
jgi:hypothetical protein